MTGQELIEREKGISIHEEEEREMWYGAKYTLRGAPGTKVGTE